MERFSDFISSYKKQLEKGDIQKAYEGLVKYVMRVKSIFSRNKSDRFSVGNVSPGYMDFTYFPFFDEFLRERKLRLGMVFNHNKVRFEIWLMGQNKDIQKRYWNHLKTTKWNKARMTMPKYSVLEAVLVENPDFENLDELTHQIEIELIKVSNEIIGYLKTNDIH
jgi:hypothetical protein